MWKGYPPLSNIFYLKIITIRTSGLSVLYVCVFVLFMYILSKFLCLLFIVTVWICHLPFFFWLFISRSGFIFFHKHNYSSYVNYLYNGGDRYLPKTIYILNDGINFYCCIHHFAIFYVGTYMYVCICYV